MMAGSNVDIAGPAGADASLGGPGTTVASRARAANLGHGFKQALLGDGLSIIAEVKRRSPSAGDLRADADAASLAVQYRAGGAACLSVLTDGPRFGGSPEDLRQARDAAGIPVLRKDFLTSLADVRESRAMGADAMLAIVADVDRSLLRALHELALELGLDVLTEVRTEPELEAAAAAGAYMIAVNQRSEPKDTRFTVDFDKAVEMSSLFAGLDDGVVTVAASGIGVEGGTPMGDLVAAGYDAALIGEALVTAPDPTAKLQSLLSDAAASRPRPAQVRRSSRADTSSGR